MSTVKNLDALRFYRFICKNVTRPPISTLYRDIMERNRGKEITQKQINHMKQYMFLFSTTSENKELLLRYRIGVTRETINDVEKISRRVGLRLPKTNSQF